MENLVNCGQTVGCYSSGGGGSTQVGKAVCVEEISSDLTLTRQLFTLTFYIAWLHTTMESDIW